MYDLIIIGAGPAGIMASIEASKNGLNVLLIEKNDVIGNKLQLTGGGRCNITNLKDTNEFINSLPTKNSKFLYSSFSNFNSYDLYYYMNELGIELKEEDNNRIFPVSNKSIDIINALKKAILSSGVELKLNEEVVAVFKEELFEIETLNNVYESRNLLIATGGISYPHTGSSGDGYIYSEDLGHSIVENYPCEAPLISQEKVIQKKVLQGLTFSNILVNSYSNNKILKSFTGDLVFTHFGVSGPVAFKHSQFIYHELQKGNKVYITIDLLKKYTKEEYIDKLSKLRSTAKGDVKNIIKEDVGVKVAIYITESIKLNNKRLADVSNKELDILVSMLKEFKISINDVKPVQNAFVTGGGVSLNEIDPKTLESKKVKGLYFAGEVLDVHGFTGGYNITIAFSTGYTVGNSVKKV